MGEKDIFVRVKKKRSYLNKIIATKIDKKPSDVTVDVNHETKYVILNNTKESLVIRVDTRISVEPEALFSIELEHIIEFMLNEEITNEEIENNIEKIIGSLGTEISYIVASITKEMIGSHMILPPVININTIDK